MENTLEKPKLITLEFTPGENPTENLLILNLLKELVQIDSRKKFTIKKKNWPVVIIESDKEKKRLDIEKLEHYLSPQLSYVEFYFGEDQEKSIETLSKLKKFQKANSTCALLIQINPSVKIEGRITELITISEVTLFVQIEKMKTEKFGISSIEKVASITETDRLFNS
jgi:hypothetical protein